MTTTMFNFIKRRKREDWQAYVDRIESRGLQRLPGCSRAHCHGAHYTVQGGDLPSWVQDLVGDREVSEPEAPPEEYEEQVFRECSTDVDWSHALATHDDFDAMDDWWPTTESLEIADEARKAGITTQLDVAFYITGVEQFGLQIWTLILGSDAPATLVRSTRDRLVALFPDDDIRMTYEMDDSLGGHVWTFC